MLHLEFCDYYSYPPQIKEHLIQILSIVDPSKIRSVLLYGSTASGEIGFHRSDTEFELYSDYDLVFIAHGKVDKHYRKKLSAYLSGLGKRFSNNLLSNVTFKYIDIKTYKKGLHNVSIVTHDDGIVVFGEDLRNEMRELNSKTFNPLFHNEMLIWELWRMILFFPIQMFSSERGLKQEIDQWIYVLCKGTLVIPMWFLPLEGVFFSSYRKRTEYIEMHYHDLHIDEVFGENFVTTLRECYSGKTGLGIKRDMVELYQETLNFFLSAKSYLLSRKGLYKNDLLTNTRGHFFIDNDIRRILYDVYLLVFKSDHMNIGKAIEWTLSSKYGLMFDMLYNMNMSLAFYLGKEFSAANKYLDRTYRLSEKLILEDSLRRGGTSLSFPATWIALRNAFAEFLGVYIPSLKSFNDAVLEVNNGRIFAKAAASKSPLF